MANRTIDSTYLASIVGSELTTYYTFYSSLRITGIMSFLDRNRFYNELQKIKDNFPGWSFSSYRYRKQQQKQHCKVLKPARTQKKNIQLHQRADKSSMKEQLASLVTFKDAIQNGFKGKKSTA